MASKSHQCGRKSNGEVVDSAPPAFAFLLGRSDRWQKRRIRRNASVICAGEMPGYVPTGGNHHSGDGISGKDDSASWRDTSPNHFGLACLCGEF